MRLVADGTTVLLTTQYLEEADQLASRVVVIDRGQVIADDTPAQLKSHLGNTVIELDMVRDDRAARAAELLRGGFEEAPRVEGPRVSLLSSDGSRPLLDVLRALETHGLVPGAVAVREPSLDDVFLQLTGHSGGADPAVGGSGGPPAEPTP